MLSFLLLTMIIHERSEEHHYNVDQEQNVDKSIENIDAFVWEENRFEGLLEGNGEAVVDGKDQHHLVPILS